MVRDLFDLTGRVAIVSGASGWLGPSMVAALAGYGAAVVAVARDAARAETALAGVDGAVQVRSCDVTSEDWPALVAGVAREHGRLDVLVNNAHVGTGGSLRTAPRSAYTQALDLAVLATTAAINAGREGFAASISAGGSPSVVNVASMYGMVSPDPGLYAREELRNPPFYGAAKAALLQLTRYAAAELGHDGVRVNALTPGPFPSTAAQQDPGFVERLSGRTMLGRVGRPEELQTALLFLASPASTFVTATNIVVDGGWTAW